MNVTKRVCDRCGKELSHRIWFSFKRKMKLTAFFLGYRTPDPYNYFDREYEFCDECGTEIRDFIRNKSKTEDLNESNT